MRAPAKVHPFAFDIRISIAKRSEMKKFVPSLALLILAALGFSLPAAADTFVTSVSGGLVLNQNGNTDDTTIGYELEIGSAPI